MPEYKVEIFETNSRIVKVKAVNEVKAMSKVSADYLNRKIILGADDNMDIEFFIV